VLDSNCDWLKGRGRGLLPGLGELWLRSRYKQKKKKSGGRGEPPQVNSGY